MTITKDKIAVMLNSKLGLSIIVCEEIINRFFLTIQEISAKEKLTLKNFGNFEMITKISRPGINFHTKLPVVIPEKILMKFSPAQKLKTAVNDGE